MKQAVLLHGTGGSGTDYFWFADTKAYVEARGYSVWWQQLPHTEKPELVESTKFLQQNLAISPDDEVIIIAHSSGCPLALNYIQHVQPRIKQLVLVAGFYQSLNDDGYSDLMLPANGFDWGEISCCVERILLINSDNDPWGCDDKQAQTAVEQLGAEFILAAGQGHMGSGTFNQPYREFALLKELLAV